MAMKVPEQPVFTLFHLTVLSSLTLSLSLFIYLQVCREVQAARRKTKQSLLDRVLGNKAAAGLRVYARGKSDSALPKE